MLTSFIIVYMFVILCSCLLSNDPPQPQFSMLHFCTCAILQFLWLSVCLCVASDLYSTLLLYTTLLSTLLLSSSTHALFKVLRLRLRLRLWPGSALRCCVFAYGLDILCASFKPY